MWSAAKQLLCHAVRSPAVGGERGTRIARVEWHESCENRRRLDLASKRLRSFKSLRGWHKNCKTKYRQFLRHRLLLKRPNLLDASARRQPQDSCQPCRAIRVPRSTPTAGLSVAWHTSCFPPDRTKILALSLTPRHRGVAAALLICDASASRQLSA